MTLPGYPRGHSEECLGCVSNRASTIMFANENAQDLYRGFLDDLNALTLPEVFRPNRARRTFLFSSWLIRCPYLAASLGCNHGSLSPCSRNQDPYPGLISCSRRANCRAAETRHHGQCWVSTTAAACDRQRDQKISTGYLGSLDTSVFNESKHFLQINKNSPKRYGIKKILQVLQGVQ